MPHVPPAHEARARVRPAGGEADVPDRSPAEATLRGAEPRGALPPLPKCRGASLTPTEHIQGL